MAIHFTKVRWKNFLSTGNAYTELQLDKRPTTLVVGENGSGKSTMLDAICFALFGKPYRNINKPQVVNSINGKNCVVEIEFTIGQKAYHIIRGMKPNIFEIWVDGELLNQEASTRDYQKYLEEHVLKLNFKSFTQIVILGTASFIPFMQLPAAARREVIEDLLDIKIFGAMNQVLKKELSAIEAKSTNISQQILIAKNAAHTQDAYVKTLVKDKAERVAEIEDKIAKAEQEEKDLQIRLGTLRVKTDNLRNELDEYEEVFDNLQTAKQRLAVIDSDISKLDREIVFFETNNSCPRCSQHIDDHVKHDNIDTLRGKQQTLMTAKKNTQKAVVEFSKTIEHLRTVRNTLEDVNLHTASTKAQLSNCTTTIQQLYLEKSTIQNNTANIDVEKAKLKQIGKDTLKLVKERSALNEQIDYYNIAGSMLKDTGIKTRIIRQYVPVINKLVNKYLTAMDFFVQFTLDEKFDENIKSRHRDVFSYESFSEGEKQRIDLALLFTWRTIAKMKNSASTNLLILDEVFDSSLDAAGTEYVMALLNEIGDNTNVWVISHKGDVLADKFSNTIKFALKQNFSTIQ